SFIFFGVVGSSQISSNLDKVILVEAAKMMESFRSKDYDRFIAYTYPKLIEIAGGKEKMLIELEKGLDKLKEQGISIDTVMFSKPNSIIEINGELQTTLVETLIMTIPQGKMASKSSLVCISTDRGATWFFVEASSKDLKEMQAMFPNLSNDLVIEKMGKPRVYKE
ncbi:MAG TPA: hypothetical protein VHO90_15745, partial [Bacteroidales bacterium]|nr:hypothetical protein [Bacteroidales bacterium]